MCRPTISAPDENEEFICSIRPINNSYGRARTHQAPGPIRVCAGHSASRVECKSRYRVDTVPRASRKARVSPRGGRQDGGSPAAWFGPAGPVPARWVARSVNGSGPANSGSSTATHHALKVARRRQGHVQAGCTPMSPTRRGGRPKPGGLAFRTTARHHRARRKHLHRLTDAFGPIQRRMATARRETRPPTRDGGHRCRATARPARWATEPKWPWPSLVWPGRPARSSRRLRSKTTC